MNRHQRLLQHILLRHGDGKTYEEAVANAKVIIKEWIETAREEGRSIPEPKGRLMYA